MKDSALPLRKAYYTLLNGNISVPVYDDTQALGDDENLYVLLGNQASGDTSPLSGWSNNQSINLQIVYKSAGQTNKEKLDIVANEIMTLLLPDRTGNALPFDPDFQFLNVVLESSNYLSMAQGKSLQVSQRILIFTQDVIQK